MFLLNGLGQRVKRSLGLDDEPNQPNRLSLAKDQSSYNQQFFNATLAEAAPYLPSQQHNSSQGLLPAAKSNNSPDHTSPLNIGNGNSDSAPDINSHAETVNRSDNSAMVMRNMNGMSAPGQSASSTAGYLNPRTRETVDTAIVLSRQSALTSPSGTIASAQGSEQHSGANGAITVAAPPSLPIVSQEMSEIAEVALRQAEVFIRQKDWEKAVKACERALSIDPTVAEAHKLMGNILQYMGNPADAISCYVEALVLNPKYPEVYANLGTVYSTLEDWKQAFSYYHKAVELNPKFEGAYRHLVKAWKQLGKPEKYISTIQKAMMVTPETFTPEEHCQMGDRFLKQGKEQDAIICFNHALTQQGDFTPAHQALAQILEKQGNWEQAVNHYTKVLDASKPSSQSPAQVPQPPSAKKQPSANFSDSPPENTIEANETEDGEALAISIDSLMSLARSYVQHNNLEKAITHYKNVLRLAPKAVNVYQELAEVLTKTGQPEQALESWYRVVMLGSDWATPPRCVEVGNQLLGQKQSSKAIDCYRQALQLDPNFTPAQERLNAALRPFGQSQATVNASATTVNAQRGGALPKKSDDVVETSQSDTAAMAAMQAHKQGEELANQERWHEAIAAYRQAIELNPNFSWSHHNLGKALFVLEDWQGAVEAQRKAIALDNKFAWSYHSMGMALSKLDQLDEAIEAFQMAQSLDKENSEIIAHQLVSVYQQLLAKDPRNLTLYLGLGQQLVESQREDEAVSTYEIALQINPQDTDIALGLSDLISEKDPQRSAELRQKVNPILRKPNFISDIKTPADLYDLERVQSVLEHTGLIEADYYSQKCNEIPRNTGNLQCISHYLEYGCYQGYNPNPLFNNNYYLQQNEDVARLGVNPLAHYHVFGYRHARNPHPFFSGSEYYRQNPDIAATEVNPLAHYLRTGAKQGRVAFAPEQLEPLLASSTPQTSPILKYWHSAKSDIDSEQALVFAIYVSSVGNYFITEIADWLAEALRRAGQSVIRLNENDIPPSYVSQHIIVGPHEFFYLGNGPQFAQKVETLENFIMMNIEQPQTGWFSKAFHYFRHCKLVLDINIKSASLIESMGLNVRWLPLGFLPKYEPLQPTTTLENVELISLPASINQSFPAIEAPLSQRPVDLHFLGTLNSRREQFFSEHQKLTSEYNCFFHTPTAAEPLQFGQDDALDATKTAYLSRCSKILLNIHRSDLPYFPWHRIAFQGLWHNTLVVTEPCHEIPGLVPGEHFIACPQSEMVEKVRFLLRSDEGQREAERVRQAGYRAFTNKFDALSLVRQFVQDLICLEH